MISEIKIRDFKSIRNVELNLEPATVLIGRSGSGKSNIVRAIRFLRNYLLSPNDAVGYEGGWARIVPVGEEKPKTSLTVTFRLPSDEKDYRYEVSFVAPTSWGASGGEMKLASERLDLGTDVVFARTLDEKGRWRWDQAPPLVSPPPLSDHPMIGTMPALQSVVFAYAALSTGIGFYHFPSSVMDPHWTKDPRQDFLKSLPGLSDDARNFREVMRALSQDFHNPYARKSILSSLQIVNRSVASVELDSLSDPKRAIVGHRVANKVVDFSLEQESDGFRRFYAHLLALYQAPAKLLLVFEEPENAIFPGAMSLLADEFKAASRENRGQVLLTTHNPALLDHFEVDAVRVVEMVDGATRVGRVSREQRDSVSKHLLTTGELLSVSEPRIDEPSDREAA